MDFKDFIIDLYQDYGAMIYPVLLLSLYYTYKKINSKSASQQFGLGQGMAVTVSGPQSSRSNRRGAANDQIEDDISAQEHDANEDGSSDHEEDGLTEIDYESGDFQREYGIDNDEDDYESDEPTYADEPEEFDEQEEYGDYLDHQSRQKNSTPSTPSKPLKGKSTEEPELDPLIIMYLVPRASKEFLGYELLQALSNYNVHLSEKKHFQRFANEDGSGELWYHVASLTHPGTFDMSEPGKLTCNGLVFIIETDKVDKLEAAYESMLTTCDYLADDLDAEMLDEKQQVFDENKARKTKYFIAKQKMTEKEC